MGALLGMPMSLAVLTRETNWINTGVPCTRPEVYQDIKKGGCATIATLELQEL